jgi:hypothetical protein
MASGITNFAGNKYLDYVWGAQIWTIPSTWYIALYTATPTASTSGAEVSTTGTAYVRQAVTNNLSNWPAASSRSKQNASAITWATATANYGTVTGAAFTDASSAGNIWYFFDLTSSVAVNSGAIASFAANAITISTT